MSEPIEKLKEDLEREKLHAEIAEQILRKEKIEAEIEKIRSGGG